MKVYNPTPHSRVNSIKKSPIRDILRKSFNMNLQNQEVLDKIISAKIENVRFKFVIHRAKKQVAKVWKGVNPENRE
jgi:hypothetical protein